MLVGGLSDAALVVWEDVLADTNGVDCVDLGDLAARGVGTADSINVPDLTARDVMIVAPRGIRTIANRAATGEYGCEGDCDGDFADDVCIHFHVSF